LDIDVLDIDFLNVEFLNSNLASVFDLAWIYSGSQFNAVQT